MDNKDARIAELTAEVALLRDDAERYRKLKNEYTHIDVGAGGKFNFPDFGVVHFEWRRREWKDGKPYVSMELDAAIDIAHNALEKPT